VRIEAAKKSLETSRKNINEVMYETGYSDTKAFRTIFSRIAGMSPMDYRHRYNREAILA
jgi:YesN/AraC family two-component response regulator